MRVRVGFTQMKVGDDDDNPGIKRTMEIIPMFDMIELQGMFIPKIGILKYEDINTFICCTLEPIPSGFLVSLLVKNPSSASYFECYGWVPESYPILAEMYTMELGLSQFDKLYKRKARILQKLSITHTIFFMVKPDLFLCDIEHEVNRNTYESIFAIIQVIQGNEGR